MRRWRKKRVIALGLGILITAAAFTTKPVISVMGQAQKGIQVPVLMYHSVLKDPKMAGDYVVSPDTMEQDFKYLQQNGYTTVFVQDLVDYVTKDVPLPDKPVVITLDDGYLNNLTYVLPLLEKYEMKAIISVVGKYTEQSTKEGDEKPSYSYLTVEEIRQLAQSGRVEIGVHSYDMHGQQGRKGAGKRKGESTEEYQAAFRADTEKALALLEQSGVKSTIYTYPFGEMSKDSEPVLQELGFEATFSCREVQNYITKEKTCLWGLGRYNRPSGISTEQFMKKALDL